MISGRCWCCDGSRCGLVRGFTGNEISDTFWHEVTHAPLGARPRVSLADHYGQLALTDNPLLTRKRIAMQEAKHPCVSLFAEKAQIFNHERYRENLVEMK